ncbi:sulfotransferase [Thalassotalea maritima]|uniref:tetratricopeptide repeat-containing sulfotransferase family protein n=1 Tax=Thalassotalea maritima TaxID=3242416 RepID=UPI00352736BE
MQFNPQAVTHLQQKIAQSPTNRVYYDQLAGYFSQFKKWREAVRCYQPYIELQPNDADGHFNFAYQLKLAQDYKQSIECYQRAYALGISSPEEVFLNIALIYSDFLRDNDNARKALDKALTIKPDYISALYNLANLEEDDGHRQEALTLFSKIIELQPGYIDAHARILHLQDCQSAEHKAIKTLTHFCQQPPNRETLQSHISARYALGKAFDDLQQYSDAGAWYQQANTLNRYILPAYNKMDVADTFGNIKQYLSKDFVAQHQLNNADKHIFVCGMFRSGSTLLEQVLAGHSAITAGGEREYLLRELKALLPHFPSGLNTIDENQLTRIAKGYQNDLHNAFADANLVIDKRPDNFIYVGLILTMFPNAKIIFSRRNVLDNCLSNYFLQLGPSYHYAADLKDCLHYYQQQQALIDHWCALFPNKVFIVDYENLVTEPEPTVASVLAFLELSYEPGCLDFYKNSTTVKTASVWQVRKPLYTSSSGRWKNYQGLLTDALGDDLVAQLTR